jgi:hypothetical protein
MMRGLLSRAASSTVVVRTLPAAAAASSSQQSTSSLTAAFDQCNIGSTRSYVSMRDLVSRKRNFLVRPEEVRTRGPKPLPHGEIRIGDLTEVRSSPCASTLTPLCSPCYARSHMCATIVSLLTGAARPRARTGSTLPLLTDARSSQHSSHHALARHHLHPPLTSLIDTHTHAHTRTHVQLTHPRDAMNMINLLDQKAKDTGLVKAYRWNVKRRASVHEKPTRKRQRLKREAMRKRRKELIESTLRALITKYQTRLDR